MQQTADGGFILGGFSYSNISGDKTENSNGNADYWIIKIDSLGIIQWQNTIGGNLGDLLSSLQQTADGGYILGGISNSNISGDKTENSMGSWDYWIVKIDSLGNVQWQNTIGGSDNDYLNSIQQTTDGGYILGGHSESNISGDKTENNIDTIVPYTSDYWIVKTDTAGNIQWQNTIGGNNRDYLYSIAQTTDTGYILGGFSTSNASGDKTENSLGAMDYWVIKLAPDTITGISPTPALPGGEGIAITPNPASQYAVISGQFAVGNEIRITDVFGRTIFTKTFSSPAASCQLPVANFPQGIYLVNVFADKGIFKGKMIIAH